MRNSKRSFCMAISLVALFLAGAVAADAAVVDKVMVVVNDEVITQREFDRAVFPVKQKIEARYSGDEMEQKIEEAEQGILDELVKTKLAVSLAKKQKLEINEVEVKRRIGTLRSYYRNEAEFLQSLSDKGTNLSELEKEIKDQILAQKLIEKEISARIVIPPLEVKELYDKNVDKLISPSKVKVRGIMVRKKAGVQTAGDLQEDNLKTSVASKMNDDFVAGVLNRSVMNKSIEEIQAELKQGGDFAAIAAKYSEGPFAKKGGDMGYVVPGQVLEEIDKVVFSLKKGEVSNIVETPIGYHIFLVEDIQGEKPLEFSEVSDYLREQLYMRKFATDLAKWFTEKKQDAYIEYK
ncbi:MAG: peptidylprolyl isomerase [Candidatus Omnitrophota bacterium]